MPRNIITIIISSLMLISCQKDEIFSIFKNGKTVTERRIIVGDFNTIEMYDNVNVVLIQDDTTYVELITGENLIEGIITSVQDSALIIRNDNRFDWLRSYDYPLILHLHFKELKHISYHATASLTTDSPILGASDPQTQNSTDQELCLHIFEGSGDIDIKVDVRTLRINYHFGTSKVHCSGHSTFSYIYQNSFGPIYADDLYSNYVFLTNKSINDTYVRFSVAMHVAIAKIGNIYYRGDYNNISVEKTGEGRLIKITD